MAAAPTMTERKARKFEPRTINFPASTQDKIAKWLDENITSLKKKYRNLHTNRIPKLRRIVDGKPREENKSWPFPNCSNLVHQLAGEAVDDLAARVLQLIWLTSPIAIFQYFVGNKDNPTEAAHNSKKAKALQRFVDYTANDPNELELYPRENRWFVDAAGLGKGWVCVAPERRMEAVYAGYDDIGEGKARVHFEEKTLYEGPRVINLRYEDILVDHDEEVFENNDPVVRICTLTKRKIQERVHKGFFKADEARIVLARPDRYGDSEVRKRENVKKGISDTQETALAQWDVYEAYFSWYHRDVKHRLIAWYHLSSKTMLNCVYNFIPDNNLPIIETRLSVDGKGAAEMLEDAQEEISTTKNQRNDAMTWGMLGINTLDPQNKNVDKNFVIWPGVTLPVNKDAFSHTEVANPAMSAASLQNEQAMIQMARERIGVGPPLSGMGAGSTNKKGQFGSMGTIAVLQADNSRTGHRTSDFRHSHTKLISRTTDFYGFMGLGRKGSLFGIDEELLIEALVDYISRKLRIPVRAATASMNREVTKQNQMILVQAITAYVKETSQQLQAAVNPTTPPEYKAWLWEVIVAKNRLMQQIVRDFQITDQPEEYVPTIEAPKEQPNAQRQVGNPAAGNGKPGLAEMAALIQRRRGGGGSSLLPGMGGTPNGPVQ